MFKKCYRVYLICLWKPYYQLRNRVFSKYEKGLSYLYAKHSRTPNHYIRTILTISVCSKEEFFLYP